ncbi:MAG: 8-oxo-dGTP diphosphatase MutT [Verrucomicrobia bacterium]|nr:8-oxo-dGTP diphosphatase MutT [Verrucomicrobiota bacterium]
MSGPTAIEVAAAIVRRGSTILIAQRHTHDSLANYWEFPGGKREPQETFEQCLARELQEELAITIRVGRLVHDVTHAYPERTVRLCFFECELLAGEPKPLDCQDCRWVSAAELRHYKFPPADDELIELLTKPAETHPRHS